MAAGAMTAVIGGAIFVVTWGLREHLPTSYEFPYPRTDEDLESRGRYLARAQHEEEALAHCRQLAESFLADIQARRFDQAYNALIVSHGEKIERETFETFVRRLPVFHNPRLPMQSKILEGAPLSPTFFIQYSCTAEDDDGKMVEVKIDVGNGDGGQGICWFLVGNARLSTDALENIK